MDIEWDSLFKIVGIVGSFASIIALPIAVWQILAVKKQVADSQNNIEKVMAFVEHDKIEVIEKALNVQHDKLIKLKMNYAQPGVNWDKVVETVNNIVVELTRQEHELPADYVSEMKSLRRAVKELSDFLKVPVNERDYKVKWAEDSLHSCLLNLKKRNEEKTKEELRIITEKK